MAGPFDRATIVDWRDNRRQTMTGEPTTDTKGCAHNRAQAGTCRARPAKVMRYGKGTGNTTTQMGKGMA